MKKTLILLCIVTVAIAKISYGQSMGSDYRTAIGVKFYPAGISIKHFIQDDRALEGVAYFWDHGFRFTGLYEIYGDINGAEGLKWYIGPGAHIGAYNGGAYARNGHVYHSGDISLGIDGVAGLDYKIRNAPIDLSLDVQPIFELLSSPYVDVWGGIGVRYTF